MAKRTRECSSISLSLHSFHMAILHFLTRYGLRVVQLLVAAGSLQSKHSRMQNLTGFECNHQHFHLVLTASPGQRMKMAQGLHSKKLCLMGEGAIFGDSSTSPEVPQRSPIPHVFGEIGVRHPIFFHHSLLSRSNKKTIHQNAHFVKASLFVQPSRSFEQNYLLRRKLRKICSDLEIHSQLKDILRVKKV